MGQFAFVCYLIAGYTTISFFIITLLTLTKFSSRFILYPFLFFLFLFNEIELFLYLKFHNYITSETLGILFDTNWNETKEFLASYVPWWSILGLFPPIILVTLCHFSTNQIRINKRIPQTICSIIIGSCICLFIYNPAPFTYGDNIMTTYIFKPSEHVDLTKHLTNEAVDETSKTHPHNIVIIIGESFARKHSSLYGYKLNTNPKLTKLKKDSCLYVFSNVTSPELITKESFKYILNTKKKGLNDNLKWYEHTTIVEVLKNAGYRTKWFSNQEKTGVTADNLPSSFSSLCDDIIFNDKKKNKYDDFLIDIDPFNSKGNQLIIYHLMGQHPSFEERYPKEFETFTPSDYMEFPKNQRVILSKYDNACLYNDNVVYNIIRKYEKKDAVIFYFSDHGFDVFDSDPSFAGHANHNNKISERIGKEIPFMVYISKQFGERNPTIKEKIKKSLNNPFCTDCLTFSIMDIAGYKFEHNNYTSMYTFIK